MDQPYGEPPSDRVMEEFRLWRTALAAHGHVLPGGPVVVGEAAALPAVDARRDKRRPRWPAVVFVGALVLAVAAAGHRHSTSRQTTTHRLPSTTRPPMVPPSTPAPAPERPVLLEEVDQRRVEQADHIAHAGEALALSGDAAGALQLYRQSLSIRRELAAYHPGDSIMQRALADGWDKVADTLVTQADTERAEEAYREAEVIWEDCAQAQPGNVEVQRRRSLTALSLGNVLLAREDPVGAAEAFQRGVSVQETLCRQEPNNAAWQEDLALGCLRLSDALGQRGDDEAALGACRRAVAIDEALVAREATNVTWQSDLATAHNKAGDLLLARREGNPDLQEYTVAASLWEKLAATDSGTERRRSLAETQDRIGQALETKEEPAAALPFYQQALDIVTALVTESPADQELKTLHATICFHRGRTLADCRPVDVPAARAALREAHSGLTALRSADGTYPDREQAVMLTAVEQLLVGLDDRSIPR